MNRRARVILTTELPASVATEIRTDFEVRDLPLRQLGAAAFLTALGAPDAIVVAPGDPIDADLIAALPASVKLLASYSTGLDHVDVPAAAARGIEVSSTPDVLTDATADVALMLILTALRGAGPARDLLHAGQWRGWAPAQIFGRDLKGRVLGIIGPGRIGQATAQRARAFGMRLRYWSARRRSEPLDALGAAAVPDFRSFLSGCDVLSLHCPLTAETRNLIDANAIAALPPGAVLINTARGDLVDDDAVIAALASGQLGAAGFDVFRGEPDLDPRYLTAPNTFLLPHIGSSTAETRQAMGRVVLAHLRRVLL